MEEQGIKFIEEEEYTIKYYHKVEIFIDNFGNGTIHFEKSSNNLTTLYDVIANKINQMEYSIVFVNSYFIENDKSTSIKTIVHEYWSVTKFKVNNDKISFFDKIKNIFK